MTEHKARSKTIMNVHEELGIPESYVDTCKLDYQPECETLVATETDVFGRQPLMDASAFIAWQAMQASARGNGIELQIVSAYRSVEYQKDLLLKKLQRGETMGEILRVNAAPGFSEHHSGCALDITTPGYTPLEEEFENSAAFKWLTDNAADFGFSMSFPRDNAAGMSYEPWHWKFSAKTNRE